MYYIENYILLMDRLLKSVLLYICEIKSEKDLSGI